MSLTARSHIIQKVLPAVQAGVRSARLRPAYADEALQQSLVALVPHVQRLSAMPDNERLAYAFVVGSRTAMAVRKRVGLELARAGDDVEAWGRAVPDQGPDPETHVRLAESAQRAARVRAELPTQDQRIVHAVVGEGLSEREAAAALGMSRGNVAYRLRRAREALAKAWAGTTTWARKRE